MSKRNKLDKAFDFYLGNQAEIVAKHNGKYVVIVDDEVVGVYDDEILAVEESSARFEKGTFLVQHVSPGKDEYTEVFHSRVAFH